jgi:hypothetical protein
VDHPASIETSASFERGDRRGAIEETGDERVEIVQVEVHVIKIVVGNGFGEATQSLDVVGDVAIEDASFETVLCRS